MRYISLLEDFFFLSWFAIKAGGVGVTGVLYNHLAIGIEEA